MSEERGVVSLADLLRHLFILVEVEPTRRK